MLKLAGAVIVTCLAVCRCVGNVDLSAALFRMLNQRSNLCQIISKISKAARVISKAAAGRSPDSSSNSSPTRSLDKVVNKVASNRTGNYCSLKFLY